MKYTFFVILFVLITIHLKAQVTLPEQLSLTEYLGYVKKYHPLTQQANLELSIAEAELMAARGGFDPKIEVDFDKKEFKSTSYYSLLNSSFKIPTWYGIEIKAAFENNTGYYINPQSTTPNNGLASLGLTIPLAQGLVINKRLADVRMAKIQLKASAAEQKLQAAEAIYNASVAYFDWKKAYDEVNLYNTYLIFATERYKGIRELIKAGDKPAIDSVEAGILLKTRRLSLTDAQLKLTKARLELSNYIWIENIPVELNENITPEDSPTLNAAYSLNVTENLAQLKIDHHPKMEALQSKLDIMNIDRQYKANLLLPKVDLTYNYLSQPSYLNNVNFDNYKIGFNLSYPIFVRKERGNLKLAKIKIQDGQLDLDLTRVTLKNKIQAQRAEIDSLDSQKRIITELVEDHSIMLKSEEKLFSYGESSLFLINSRENNLVSSKLSEISLENRRLRSIADLFRTLATP